MYKVWDKDTFNNHDSRVIICIKKKEMTFIWNVLHKENDPWEQTANSMRSLMYIDVQTSIIVIYELMTSVAQIYEEATHIYVRL